jgi:hypothetical protein
MKLRRKWAAGLILVLAGLCLLGCKERQPYAGKFISLNETPEITLDLKPNGEGIWSSGDQRVTFRWEVKGERIWFHAKGGGVLVGTPLGDRLSLDMSGDLYPGCLRGKCVEFKRLPEGG